MRKSIAYFLVILLLLLAPSAIRYAQFYELGNTDVQPPPRFDPADVANVSAVPTPAAGVFVDTPVVGDEGQVLLDRAHANDFTMEEIAYLDGRLSARGYEMISYSGSDLAATLRDVSAFIVITPQERFTPGEVRAVRDFVDRGGRLLLVGDPTRFSVFVEETEFSLNVDIEQDAIPLNSLANAFSLAFNGDYLYNTVENEGNFRNIILDDAAFAEAAVTDGLERVVFYSAHSLQVGAEGEALITADANTWSSATDRPGELVVAAGSENGRVLAVGDIHMLLEPYYTVFDNGQFVAHIADFLTTGAARAVVLTDFPYFYRQTIDLIYTGSPDLGPDAFDEIIELQEAFRLAGKDLRLATAADAGHDALYLGLYNQPGEAAELLAAQGISLTISPPILTAAEETAMADATAEERAAEPEEADADADAETGEGDGDVDEEAPEAIRLLTSPLGSVQMSGTALLYLHEANGQRRLVVLAASAAGLETAVGRLLDLIPLRADYALADCLVQDSLALCPTQITAEAVEAELLSGGEPAADEADTPPAEEDEAEREDASEGEDEPDEGMDDAGGGELPDAADQGPIELEETVSGVLEADEVHGWTFAEGPATIEILLESDELDSVLELYGPDGELLDGVDGGFAGEPERLDGVEIPDDGTYTILVRDFFGAPGAYTLRVREVAPGEEAETGGSLETIFIFADDDGEPLNGGLLSHEYIAAQLADAYTVTSWLTSADGPLQPGALDDVDLLVWDSGDYRDEEGFLDDDLEIIFEYLDSGQGGVLIVGTAPVLFNYLEPSRVDELELVGEDPVLLDGLSSGEVFALETAVDAVVPDVADEDLTEQDTVFLVRGPDNGSPGAFVGLASIGDAATAQRTALLLVPLIAMPESIRETLLTNLMTWFADGE